MATIPEIALIDTNMLTCMGLRGLILRLIPEAVVRCFTSFEKFMDDTPDMYFHYFVSPQIAFEHILFFLERVHKTILVSPGVVQRTQLDRFRLLDCSQSEEDLMHAFTLLLQKAHGRGQHLPGEYWNKVHETGGGHLTPREMDVLALIVKGLINKEIADKLNIGLTTVITHRKHIMAKLGIRSTSGLAVYAVMNGYVDPDSF